MCTCIYIFEDGLKYVKQIKIFKIFVFLDSLAGPLMVIDESAYSVLNAERAIIVWLFIFCFWTVFVFSLSIYVYMFKTRFNRRIRICKPTNTWAIQRTDTGMPMGIIGRSILLLYIIETARIFKTVVFLLTSNYLCINKDICQNKEYFGDNERLLLRDFHIILLYVYNNIIV